MGSFTPISATIGGVLIGLAAVLLMYGNGRIAGISGILGGVFNDRKGLDWRLSFLAGLVLVPFIMIQFRPELKVVLFHTDKWTLLIGGLLVGLGTQLGNGCTSGHGVCGNARFSERSFTATIVFMFFGMLTVFLAKYLGHF